MAHVIEPPMTDDDVRALQQRNAERVRVAIEQLGAAWVLYKRPARPAPISINADSLAWAERVVAILRGDDGKYLAKLV